MFMTPIVALAAGLLTHFFPCCAFVICSFSKVSATPVFSITVHQVFQVDSLVGVRVLEVSSSNVKLIMHF